MTQLTDTLIRVRSAAEAVGLREFSRISQVPYTTIKSFADRGWSNKNFDQLQKMVDAAARIESDGGA